MKIYGVGTLLLTRIYMEQSCVTVKDKTDKENAVDTNVLQCNFFLKQAFETE